MTTKHNHHREWQGPMLMALAGILVLLALVSESIRQDDVSVARRLDAISSHVGQTVQLRLKANTEYLSLLADEMSAKTLDELQFQQIVSQYVIDNRDLIYVTWADSNFVIRWTAPFEPNKQVIGLSQSLPESRRASHEAKLSKRPVWTEPFEVIQGISAVEVCIPVFRGNEFIGTFSGVHSIQVLLGNDLPQSLNNNYDIALVNTEGKRYRATSILKEIDHELTRVIQLELPGGQLKLIVSAYETEPHWYLLTLTMLCICLVAGMAYSQWSLNRQLSQRKRTEKELQDGENKLLEAQGIAELGYYALDVKTGSWTNSAELNGIFGIDESYTKDIVGWLNLVHPDHRETMANYLQDDVLGQHMRFDKEYKIIDATTGREKWVHGLGILKFDENNVPVEMLGTIQNITERKRVVEALRESEAKYKGIVESSHDAIMLTGPDGIVSYISPACKQVLGYDAEELVGKQPWIIHPDDLKKVKNIFYSTMQGKSGSGFEYRINTKANETKWISHSWSPIFDDGKLQLIVSTVSDITERKLAEEKAERLVAFAKNNPAPVLRTDLDCRITLMNPAAMNLLGGDVTGESIKSVLSGSAASFSNPDSSNMPLQFEQKLGDNIYLFSIQRDESAVYVYGSNITETKRLQELESRAARLEMAGTIAGQVAHDLNNLLGPIMAYPELIHEELPHDHPAHAYLDGIEEAAGKIAEINQDLLTMGRRGHYNLETLDLNQVVLQATREMESRTKTVTCQMDLCENLMKIKGGNAQIHRVLTNLIVNAQDAMSDIGQIRIRTENYYANDTSIAFGRVPRGEYVKLTISDNGCGISDDIAQKILDPFFSTKTADKKRGSGLGLSVVDAVMRDHNGYLDLSSEVGHGTSFFLYFPITKEDATEQDLAPVTSGSETILVVDDDNVQREVSKRLLTKLGYLVNSVESGEKAIKFLRENPQDLVILDMEMPGGIDGAETYRQVLKSNPNQKAIILSGFSECERVVEAQRFGAGAFVRKPVSRKIIAYAVRTELDRPLKIPAP